MSFNRMSPVKETVMGVCEVSGPNEHTNCAHLTPGVLKQSIKAVRFAWAYLKAGSAIMKFEKQG